VRADGQEPDSRHEALDELAKDGKVQSIKGAACKFGGCAPKAVELTSGDLSFVAESRLRMEQSIPTGREKSAEGKVSTEVEKARTVLLL
jgi:hypothetical protein